MRQLYFVEIPTNPKFLNQWHLWIQGKVAKHFKRDKSRMGDTAQNVRLRLLTKDFIGRWFFKHLTDELVECEDAEKMLGGVPVALIGHLKPVLVVPRLKCEVAATKYPAYDEVQRQWLEKKKDKNLRFYRVKDVLAFARFDYERYYYSVQNHTIDSEKVLRLLGYGEGQYTALQSMWRKRGFRPSEMTEHEPPVHMVCKTCEDECLSGPACKKEQCSDKSCERCLRHEGCTECDRGRTLLRNRGLSLAHDWGSPDVAGVAAKLRWNDSQLKPYLREWRKSNRLKATPIRIVRLATSAGIDAGLLKYAQIIVDNEVTNDFKRMSRSDDLESFVRTGGVCPEMSNDDLMGWDADNRPRGEERPERVFRDTNSLSQTRQFETMRDLRTILRNSDLTDEEIDVVKHLEIDEVSVRTYSEATGIPAARVNKVRTVAMSKMRLPFFRTGTGSTLHDLARKHDCSVDDILDPEVQIGRAVIARSEVFYSLHRLGMGVPAMAAAFRFPEDRVELSLSRHPDMRTIDDVVDEMV